MLSARFLSHEWREQRATRSSLVGEPIPAQTENILAFARTATSTAARDAIRAELLRHPKHAHAHPVFGNGVRHVVLEPARREVQRRRQGQYVGVAPRLRGAA